MRLVAVRVGLSLVFAVVLGATGPVAGAAHADGAWLDAPLQNWNVPGQDVPPAPPTPYEPDPRCVALARQPETVEDSQVEKQGWKLVGMYSGGWGLKVVTGATQFDGMCRPVGFQTFVFQHGVFAGTISPEIMDSRSDGVVFDVQIRPRAVGGSSQLTASFARFTPQDPLCCASARADLEFEVGVDGGKPILKPLKVYTSPAPRN